MKSIGSALNLKNPDITFDNHGDVNPFEPAKNNFLNNPRETLNKNGLNFSDPNNNRLKT